MNVDWFKPFSHTTYSLGAIYLVLLNLPREERCKVENILLVGLIPGPREPPLVINSYLCPLVEELKCFQRGVKMELPSPAANAHTVFVKVALGPVICDIPASRKTCGFTGHSAILGCCKCLKQFETNGDKLDYSGFDTENWQPRSETDHRLHANKHRLASCRAEEKRIERTYGCRYSILLQLTYFDIVRYNMIDPMHNLLLGTAKHIFSVWSNMKIVTSDNIRHIELCTKLFSVPYNIGRLPQRLDDGMANLKADQMRNWIVIYSIICLHEFLPPEHMDCLCWLVLNC